MIAGRLDDLTAESIEELKSSGRTEGRTLEFKRDALGSSDDAKREFLADVSSLANTQGGDLIFGIADEAGVASETPGISIDNSDAEILRIESLIRDSLQPRIVGVRSRWVEKTRGRGFLIIRVPASLNGPHRIVFKNSGRFWHRHSRGKAEMDVHELREAFGAGADSMTRLRRLHGQILDLSPIALLPGPRLYVTVAPLSLGRREGELDLRTREDAALPSWGRSLSWTHILEGFLTYAPSGDSSHAQALTHRVGYVEAVSAQGSPHRPESQTVWAGELERALGANVKQALAALERHEVAGPWVVMASLEGIKGHVLHAGDPFGPEHKPATRDEFDFGHLVFEEYDDAVLLPIKNRIWWAFQEERPEGWAPRQ